VGVESPMASGLEIIGVHVGNNRETGRVIFAVAVNFKSAWQKP